jgi:hypothetical protein
MLLARRYYVIIPLHGAQDKESETPRRGQRMDEDTTTHKPTHDADVCGTFTGRPMTSFAWFIFIGLSCSRRVDELSRG